MTCVDVLEHEEYIQQLIRSSKVYEVRRPGAAAAASKSEFLTSPAQQQLRAHTFTIIYLSNRTGVYF